MIEKLKAIFQPKVKEARFQVFDNENGYTDGIPQPDKYGDMTQSFSAHSWVYAAASTIASNLASLDFKPYQLKKDGTWEDAPENELYRVLQKPNAYMSATNLREFTFLNLDLTGNGYIALERGGTKNILEAWPLPAAYVKPVSKPDRFIDHYVYEVNGKQIKYAYDEIIHFRYANPVEFKYGQGSITALKNSIAADLYADAWNRFFFQNSARPDSILETEGTLDPATRDRIRESWKAMFQGSKKRGKTALLEAGVKYKEINRTPKDLDFLALRKNAREEILGAMGVPPSMVGILEYANYANLKEQTQIFWKHTILPKARAFADTLTSGPVNSPAMIRSCFNQRRQTWRHCVRTKTSGRRRQRFTPTWEFLSTKLSTLLTSLLRKSKGEMFPISHHSNRWRLRRINSQRNKTLGNSQREKQSDQKA